MPVWQKFGNLQYTSRVHGTSMQQTTCNPNTCNRLDTNNTFALELRDNISACSEKRLCGRITIIHTTTANYKLPMHRHAIRVDIDDPKKSWYGTACPYAESKLIWSQGRGKTQPKGSWSHTYPFTQPISWKKAYTFMRKTYCWFYIALKYIP